MMVRAMGSHHSPNRGATDEWLTPPEIIDALGPFDLDPCAATNRPWDTAREHYTVEDGGFLMPWKGLVWLNPPYGPDAYKWVGRLADHGEGIALIFARTETAGFFSQVWRRADALLFLEGRLFFCRPDGTPASANAGAPSVLVAYGEEAEGRLLNSRLRGSFVESWAA